MFNHIGTSKHHFYSGLFSFNPFLFLFASSSRPEITRVRLSVPNRVPHPPLPLFLGSFPWSVFGRKDLEPDPHLDIPYPTSTSLTRSDHSIFCSVFLKLNSTNFTDQRLSEKCLVRLNDVPKYTFFSFTFNPRSPSPDTDSGHLFDHYLHTVALTSLSLLSMLSVL